VKNAGGEIMEKEEQKWKNKHNCGIYHSVIAICTMISLLLFFTANTAALVVEKDLGTLTSEADTIVTGTVTNLQSQWEDGKIFTYVTIATDDYTKGAKEGDITIRIPGGTVGNISCWVSDTPTFKIDEEILVFLRTEASYFDVVGWYQGKYTITDNEVVGTGLSVDEFTALIRGEMISEQGIEKGRTEPTIMLKDAHEVFVQSEMDEVVTTEDVSKKMTTESENEVTVSSPGWVTILSEGFEGSWPWGLWSRSGSSPCAYTWDDVSYKSHTGGWSAWCADESLGGCADLQPESNNYPNNMRAWMEYGPFDLSDATNARMTFYYWVEAESCCDYLFWGASHDGSGFGGTSAYGSSGGWVSRTLDLQPYCGDSTVWVGFLFNSDSSVTYKGAFVDDIIIEKYVGGGIPVITSITPSSGPAKAAQIGSSTAASDSTRVTISGSNFGLSPGWVIFWYEGNNYYSAAIESWSATSIVCRVPGKTSSHFQ
jgi:hypothetical protein